jgi:zinc transport system permease protein
VGGTNTDYFSLLFGDILSISNQDIIWIYTILMLVGVLHAKRLSPLATPNSSLSVSNNKRCQKTLSKTPTN